MENLFRGVYTAIVTPFDEAGNVDEAGFRNLIDFQIDNKIDDYKVDGNKQCHPLNQRILALGDGIDRQSSDTWQRENIFYDEGPTEQVTKLYADKCHHRDQCIA